MALKLRKRIRRVASGVILRARSGPSAASDEAPGVLRDRPASTELVRVCKDVMSRPLPAVPDPHPGPPPTTGLPPTPCPGERRGSPAPRPVPSTRSLPRPRPRPRPRPDSSTLPPQDQHRPPPLEPARFHAVRRDGGGRTQYWLSAEDVLAGVPGSGHVPAGHWNGLVRLAGDVRVEDRRQGGHAWVQLVTAWCGEGETIGEGGEDHLSDAQSKGPAQSRAGRCIFTHPSYIHQATSLAKESRPR